MINAIKEVSTRFDKIQLPFLSMHGTADRLTHPDGTKQLYDESLSQDKTLKLYEGLYHELINEPEKEQVIKDVIQWLTIRAKKE